MKYTFNQPAYNHSDPVKFAVVEWLNKHGHPTICIEDKSTEDIKMFKLVNYNVDLPENLFVCEQYNLEVEHRTIWKGSTFPYDSISIPARKFRHKKNNTYYIIVNNEITFAYMVHSTLLTEDRKKVKNTTRHDNESFYHIPTNLCNFVKIS